MKHIKQFEIPFVQSEVIDWKEKKNDLLKAFASVKNNLKLGADPVSHVYTDYFSNGTYHPDPRLVLRQELNYFYSRIDLRNPIITGVWMQRYTKNCFMAPHNHGATGYSCICFVKFNPEEHTATRFMAPFPDLVTGDNIEFVPSVKEGTIIFFPSALMHYALPNTSTEERVILSMNIDCKEPER